MTSISRDFDKLGNEVDYGWYHKNLMIILILGGISGPIMIIISIIVKELLGIALLCLGIMSILVILWPGLGLLMMNLLTDRNIAQPKMNLTQIVNLDAPNVLDVGCGTGRFAINIAKNLRNGRVHGIDIFKNSISNNGLDTVKRNAMVENVESKTNFQNASAEDIPFDDNFFDVVNIAYVIHEIRNKNQVLSEISRVLKPDGMLIISELHRSSILSLLLMGPMYVANKNKKFWHELIRNNEFDEINCIDKGPIMILKAKPKK